MKRIMTVALLMCILLGLCACGGNGMGGMKAVDVTSGEKKEANITVSEGGYPLTVQDYFEYETVLESPPERVAVLSGTPLNIWYDLGGKSICTSDISENLKLDPQYAQELLALPVVGAVYSLDMEAVVAQNADLVITQAGVQSTASQTLRNMDIPVIATLPRTFDDLVATYRAFGRILQAEGLAEEKIEAMTRERQSYIDQAPKEGKRIVILYLTSSSLSVKLNSSIAGDIATSLGADNIASSLPPDTIGSENTPLDIEYLVEQDPDLVLVTSMIGSNELAMETMQKQFADSCLDQSGTGIVLIGQIVSQNRHTRKAVRGMGVGFQCLHILLNCLNVALQLFNLFRIFSLETSTSKSGDSFATLLPLHNKYDKLLKKVSYILECYPFTK